MNMTYKEEISAISEDLLVAAKALHDKGEKKFHSAALINKFYCTTPNLKDRFYRTMGDLQGIINILVREGKLVAEEDWTFGLIYSIPEWKETEIATESEVKKQIYKLNLGDHVSVEMSNPGDNGYVSLEFLTVERIQKTKAGWQFMGRMQKENGDQLLCLCTMGTKFNKYACTMAAAYGDFVVGRERREAIAMLGFAPD